MRRERFSAVLRQRLLVVVALSVAGAVLFFYLGYLIAERPASLKLEALSLPVPRPRPVLENYQSLSRKTLEKVLQELESQLSVCQPDIVIDRDWQVMHNGSHEWIRVKLHGECQDIAALALEIKASKELLRRDFNLRLLTHLNGNSGTLDLLILDGEEVVVVGGFAATGAELTLGYESVRPRLAIVIDDFGQSLARAAEFSGLPLPLTFAVFPHLANSLKVAAYFTEQHRDIILHTPMEPRGYPAVDPGPGALLCEMDNEELNTVFVNDLKSLPGIIGINNHMGSRLTANSEKMIQVMNILKGRNLFFLDSRTIADTVAYKLAVEAGVPALQRDVFLDNKQDTDHITEQLQALIEVARVKGSSIGIGHPYPETALVLGLLPEMANQAGVEIVPLRELIK